MTLYGYRLHVIEARLGNKQGPLTYGKAPVEDPAGIFADQAHAVLGRVFARDATYNFEVEVSATAPLKPRVPVLRVDDVRRSGDNVEVDVSYGRAGDHAFAISTTGTPDFDLDAHAPGRQYTHIFFFSRVRTESVMVSETVGRTFAGAVLLKRLSVENARAAKDQPDTGDWLKWFPRVLIDETRVDEIIDGGHLEGIRLKRKRHLISGAPEARPLTLTQSGIRERDKSKIRDLIKSWVTRADGNKGLSNPAGEMVALVEFIDAEADVSAMGFTDGSFAFDEDGKTQSIGPSNLQRILVYPLGDSRPSPSELHAVARKRLQAISAEIEGTLTF